MGEGPILMVHIGQKIACITFGHLAGDVVIDLDGVEHLVQGRSVGSVLTLTPASLKMVDEWVARARGAQWLPIEVRQERGKAAEQKRREERRECAEYLREYVRQSDARLRARYGTDTRAVGIYADPTRSTKIVKATSRGFDPITGEVCQEVCYCGFCPAGSSYGA